MKILLVDDDEGSLQGMKLALLMLKHGCDAYSDPCEAVKNYFKGAYDLVITDIYMPSIDGFSLAEAIFSVDPKTNIIFMSGHPVETMGRQVDYLQRQLFMQKPIAFSLLQQVIDNLSIENESTQYL